METLTSFLATLNSLSPLAVIGLLSLALFWMIYKNPLRPIERSLDEVKSNHLHDLPNIAANMEKAVDVLQRIEVKLGEEFSYIKAKIDDR